VAGGAGAALPGVDGLLADFAAAAGCSFREGSATWAA
jgi:hypothetical protein